MPEMTSHTLARRIAEGRLPVSEALRYAMQVGDALRKLHDAGEVHGAVTPDQVLLTDRGAELVPQMSPQAGDSVTPYTAPEILLGRPADSRTDIFAFGALLFESLTGRRAFDGEDPAELAANLAGAPAPSSGSPAADRILGPCLVKNPDQRAARMQKILMELKLLSVAARRVEAQNAAPRQKESEVAVLRTEMQAFESRIIGHLAASEGRIADTHRSELGQAEARITARLTAHDEEIAAIQASVLDAVGSIREKLLSLSAEVATAQDSLRSRPTDQEINDRVLFLVDRGFDAVSQQMGRLEHGLDELRNQYTQFERSVSADLTSVEQNFTAHSTAIESTRTAMSQTDDLVERVVEALESLQSALLDQNEAPAAKAAVGVN